MVSAIKSSAPTSLLSKISEGPSYREQKKIGLWVSLSNLPPGLGSHQRQKNAPEEPDFDSVTHVT